MFIGHFVALARRLRAKTNPKVRVRTLSVVDELWDADSFRVQDHNGL